MPHKQRQCSQGMLNACQMGQEACQCPHYFWTVEKSVWFISAFPQTYTDPCDNELIIER